MTVDLDGLSLNISDLVKVTRKYDTISVSAKSVEKVQRTYELVKGLINQNEVLYGVSTGCGELDSVSVSPEDQKNHQENLILAHACGVGPNMAIDQARAMMLCRLNNFVRGMSGVSPQLVNTMLQFLNKKLAAVAPLLGSIGSSDLVPLAHMAASIMGQGEIYLNGIQQDAALVLDQVGIKPFKPKGRDGLAVINGLSQTVGIASLALYDLRRLINVSLAITYLNGELISPGYLKEQEEFIELKNHAKLNLLKEKLLQVDSSELNLKGRSPLSTRYALTVYAPLLDALSGAEEAVEDELNAVSDNPIIKEDGSFTNNSMNTSGARLAFALDSISQVLATACLAAERRIAQLTVKEPLNDLPPYLVYPSEAASSNYGMMITQYTAASLTMEVRARSHSRSIQSVPAGGRFEDLNANAGNSAIHLAWLTDMFELITAIEILTTLQGYDTINRQVPNAYQAFYKAVRSKSSILEKSRMLSKDIEIIRQLLKHNLLNEPEIIPLSKP